MSLYQLACVVLLGMFVCVQKPILALIWALIVLLNAATGYGVLYNPNKTDKEDT